MDTFKDDGIPKIRKQESKTAPLNYENEIEFDMQSQNNSNQKLEENDDSDLDQDDFQIVPLKRH